MNRSLARVTVIGVAILVAAAALSGCAPASHSPGPSHHIGDGAGGGSVTPSPSVTPGASPTAAPTATGQAALPANALFRITASAVQPNGATVDLVETVFAPAPASLSDIALLNKQCNFSGSPSWQSQYPGGYKDVVVSMTATIHQGTPRFNTNATIAASAGYGNLASSGNYAVAQAYCAPGSFSKIPGAIHAVAPAPNSNLAHGLYGWANHDATYGFFGDGNDPSDPNGGSGNTIVKNCAVQISAAALAAAPSLAAWKTQVYVPAKSCYYVP